MLLGMAVLSMVVTVIQETVESAAKKVQAKLHQTKRRKAGDGEGASNLPVHEHELRDGWGDQRKPRENGIHTDSDEDPYSGGLNITAEEIHKKKKKKKKDKKKNDFDDKEHDDTEKQDSGKGENNKGFVSTDLEDDSVNKSPSAAKQEKEKDNMEEKEKAQ